MDMYRKDHRDILIEKLVAELYVTRGMLPIHSNKIITMKLKCIRRDILDYNDGIFGFIRLCYYVFKDLLTIKYKKGDI